MYGHDQNIRNKNCGIGPHWGEAHSIYRIRCDGTLVSMCCTMTPEDYLCDLRRSSESGILAAIASGPRLRNEMNDVIEKLPRCYFMCTNGALRDGIR